MSHALRGLARHRAFTATALITLTLGIGANTAIISAVRGIVFRPLPYPESDRLVHIWTFWPGLRTREIGLRSALGAGRGDILRLVVGQGLRPIGLGGGVGFAGSLGLGRWVGALLFDVTASDPLTFVGVALSLSLVAIVAMILPARRALAVDPSVSLRAE